MKRTRWWFRSLVVTLVLGLAPAVALAVGCGTPPDGSGNWMFMDDVALNMRQTGLSSISYGTSRVVDDAVNYDSTTMHGVRLSWTGWKTSKYSASLKAWTSSTDTKETQKLSAKIDLKPMYEALMVVREAVQHQYYAFDAGCLWFNTDTHQTIKGIAQYGVEGSVRRTWPEATVKLRRAW